MAVAVAVKVVVAVAVTPKKDLCSLLRLSEEVKVKLVEQSEQDHKFPWSGSLQGCRGQPPEGSSTLLVS